MASVDAHMQEVKAVKQAAADAKAKQQASDVAHYHSINRWESAVQLREGLKGTSDSAAIKLMVQQTKHRTVGCSHTYPGMSISLFTTQDLNTKARKQALQKQLLAMIGIEQAEGLFKPVAPAMPDAPSSIPCLGKPDAERVSHTAGHKAKLDALLGGKDDEELLALEAEFKHKCFYDRDDTKQGA